MVDSRSEDESAQAAHRRKRSSAAWAQRGTLSVCVGLTACLGNVDGERRQTELAATSPGEDPCAEPEPGEEPAETEEPAELPDEEPAETEEPADPPDDEEEQAPDAFELPDPKERGPYEVVVDKNVGEGFELPVNALDAGDSVSNLFCEVFVQSFGADPAQAAEYAQIPPDTNMALYELYRPKTFATGQKYPVVTWGNGTCALPYGYGGVLQHLASHGFIVIAPYSRFVGDGSAQVRGIDFVLAENENPDSPLYGHVDEARIGAFGHSQGGLGTMQAAAQDPRIITVAPLNGIGSSSPTVPTFLLTGDGDLSPAASLSAYEAASVPAVFVSLNNSNHITLIEEPERVYPAVTAWFRYQLLGDEGGRAYFVGSDCALCNRDQEWTFLQKDLE